MRLFSHRVLGLDVDLVGAYDPVLLVVSGGPPVHDDRAGVEGLGGHIPGLSGHWAGGKRLGGGPGLGTLWTGIPHLNRQL